MSKNSENVYGILDFCDLLKPDEFEHKLSEDAKISGIKY